MDTHHNKHNNHDVFTEQNYGNEYCMTRDGGAIHMSAVRNVS